MISGVHKLSSLYAAQQVVEMGGHEAESHVRKPAGQS